MNAGPNIKPVYIKEENPLVISDKGPDGSHGWTSDNFAKALGVEYPLPGRYSDLYDIARQRGHDSVQIRDMADLGGYGQTQYIPLEAKNIRSVNAAFDPEKRNSANLLAGVSGLGGMTLAQMLSQPSPTEQVNRLAQ